MMLWRPQGIKSTISNPSEREREDRDYKSLGKETNNVLPAPIKFYVRLWRRGNAWRPSDNVSTMSNARGPWRQPPFVT